MSTGIVSIDLNRGQWRWASAALLVVTGIAWLAVLARGELHRDVAGVPATCVLGTRLATISTGVASVLLAAAVALWCVSMPRTPRPARATGSDFLPVVATQSVAVLGGTVVTAGGAHWLRVPSLVLFGIGLALYAPIVMRFDPRQLVNGEGDQWVAGGALAISALACATLSLGWDIPETLERTSIALWVAALVWLPALVAGELIRPRSGSVPARWATVFPIGMYAAMTFAAGEATSTDWMHSCATSWTGVALAVWALVLAYSAMHSRTAAGSRS